MFNCYDVVRASFTVFALMAGLMATTGEAGVDTGRLESLLLQDCGACHGGSLKGGLGSPLLPGRLAGRTPESLAETIMNGIPGTPMPPWRALLTSEEATWLARRLLNGAAP
ncbi:MAG: cytochrome c [Rhodospirillaceae bacterium]